MKKLVFVTALFLGICSTSVMAQSIVDLEYVRAATEASAAQTDQPAAILATTARIVQLAAETDEISARHSIIEAEQQKHLQILQAHESDVDWIIANMATINAGTQLTHDLAAVLVEKKNKEDLLLAEYKTWQEQQAAIQNEVAGRSLKDKLKRASKRGDSVGGSVAADEITLGGKG